MLFVFSFESTGVVVEACKARNKRRYHRIQFGNKPIEDQIISGSSPAGKNWRRPMGIEPRLLLRVSDKHQFPLSGRKDHLTFMPFLNVKKFLVGSIQLTDFDELDLLL